MNFDLAKKYLKMPKEQSEVVIPKRKDQKKME
jgi:hypothetical protein